MTPPLPAIGFGRSVLELFGIVLARFHPAQRIWGAWLIAVNAACLLFLRHAEARVALAAVGAAALAQAWIYQRRRFIRVLGLTHAVWIPMLAWMSQRVDSSPAGEGAFRAWLVALMATNAVSLVIDGWDATRYLRGERAPYYAW